MEGERVAGTIAAQIVMLEPGAKNQKPRMLLMWSGCEPGATAVLNRLLTQQRASFFDQAEAATMLAA